VHSAGDSLSSRHPSLCRQEQEVVVPMLQQEKSLQYAIPQVSSTEDKPHSSQPAMMKDSLACSSLNVPNGAPAYTMLLPLDNSVRLPSQDLPAILAGAVTSGQNDRTPPQPVVDIPASSPREFPTLYQQQESDLPLENEMLVSQFIEQPDVRQEQSATTSRETQPGSAASGRDVSPESVLLNEPLLSETCSSEICGTGGNSVRVEIPVGADVGLGDQLQRLDASPLATSPREGSGEPPAPQRGSGCFTGMPPEEICRSEIHSTSGNSVDVEILASADVGLDSQLQLHDGSPLATSPWEGSREPPAPQRRFKASQQPPLAADATLPICGVERASQHCQPAVDSTAAPPIQSYVLGHHHVNEAELEEGAGAVQDASPVSENALTQFQGVLNGAATAGTALSPADQTSVEEELESLQRTVAALAEQLSNLGAEAGPVAAVGLATTGKDPTHFHEGVPSLASSSEVSRSRSTCSAACSQVEAPGFLSDFLAEQRAFEEWLNTTVTAAAVMLDERDRLHRRHSTRLV